LFYLFFQLKKSKQTAPKSPVVDEVPAQKRRRSNHASPVSNRLNHNNNNDDLKKEYTPKTKAARAVIDRPEIFVKPEASELDISKISDTLKSKNITASTHKFGFIGLGIMGSGIVKNLINSGHDVCVYNRTHDKTKKFEAVGAKVMLTPEDVVDYADITFSCVADPEAVKNVTFIFKILLFITKFYSRLFLDLME
jgi:3-hydroxyisobutyrate dehydrogenase